MLAACGQTPGRHQRANNDRPSQPCTDITVIWMHNDNTDAATFPKWPSQLGALGGVESVTETNIADEYQSRAAHDPAGATLAGRPTRLCSTEINFHA